MESDQDQGNGLPSDAPAHDAQRDQSRREAILRMAAYTAPVMLAVLTSEKAMATSTGWTSSPPPTSS